MQNFYDILQKIQQRPTLYIGQNSIFSLQAFLDGYYFARRDLNLALTSQEQEFQTFLQWIRQKFNVETGQLWSSIVLSHSTDEREAIAQFFKLFDEFKLGQKLNEVEVDSLDQDATSILLAMQHQNQS